MMKIAIVIVLVLIMVRLVSSEDLSPAPAPAQAESQSPIGQSSPPQLGTEMSPSPSRLDSQFPPMIEDYPSPSGNATKDGGGKKAGIAVGVIAAASVVGFAGYVLKKRRENIRRSRYDYAATEIL